MRKFGAVLALVAFVLFLPAAAGQVATVTSENTLGVAHGIGGGVGTVASVTVTAPAFTVAYYYVAVWIEYNLLPTGLASASVNWLLDAPGPALAQPCNGSNFRGAGQGDFTLGIRKDCNVFRLDAGGSPQVNGTYYLNITGTTGTVNGIKGSLRVVAVQEFPTLGDSMILETSLDTWIPYVILGLLFIGAARANAFGVAFVAALAIGLTAAGNPWPEAAVALFAMAAGLAWWLPEWYRNYRARRATKGGAP